MPPNNAENKKMVNLVNIVICLLALALILSLAFSYQLWRRQQSTALVASVAHLDGANALQMATDNGEVSDAEERTLSDYDQKFLDRLISTVFEEMAQGHVAPETLADKLCLSRAQLNRKVHALTGVSTTTFTLQIRMKEACRLLREDPRLPISDVALRCGFDDPAYFTRLFKRQTGLSPSSYRKSPPKQSLIGINDKTEEYD